MADQCVICKKQATVIARGYTLCWEHWEKFFEYPDDDMDSYVKVKRKEKR